MTRDANNQARLEVEPILSRRGFVAAATGALVSGTLLIGCRRRAADEQMAQVAPKEQAPLEPSLPESEPTVRVRIRVNRDTSQPIHIGSEGQWVRVSQPSVTDKGFSLVAPLMVFMLKGGWLTFDAMGRPVPMHELAPIRFLPLATDPTGHGLRLDDGHYPGSLHLVNRGDSPDDGFDVVNHVMMERYLPGVLARELYNHWHEETHAAQAIAARSFACSEHAWFSRRRHFDMTNTQASQVYAGSVTHKRSVEAAEQTRGMVLSHHDKLVPGYYSSCCGGIAARAVDAIGPNPINNIRPLHGRIGIDVCTEAPVAQWSVERQRAALTRRMVIFGEARNISSLKALATIQSIEATAVNMHGRPTQYTITDQRGRAAVLPAETLRHAANYTGRGFNRPQQMLRSSHVEAEVNQRTIAFTGYGFGHGVGMCQYGAQYQARAGRHHEMILRWYYPEAYTVKAYA